MDPGIVVTDPENRIVFANRSYANLIGTEKIEEISSIETILSRRSEAADAVYKMAASARAGKSVVEEIRLDSGLLQKHDEPRWYRIRSRPLERSKNERQLVVWQISDVTEDRLAQETAFQELQDAIHYLDHAPAGFIASESDGRIVYMNATLADWLGIDLALFKPEDNNIRDLIPSDNEALFNTASSEGDSAVTNVIDLDLNCSDGKRLPVRMYHRIPVMPDGAPGTARSLVLNRANELGGDAALREAEVRFTRFFNNTPVAIAGVDKKGQVIRTNASFQSMFSNVIGDADKGKGLSLVSLANEEDRDRLQATFDEALKGSGGSNPGRTTDFRQRGAIRTIFCQSCL